jgi:uncharacterized protein involved in exopolysaccharide biosynthesis
MNATLSLPPSLVVRDLFLTALSRLKLIVFLGLCVMAAAVAIAFWVTPNFQAKSSLLVLLGTEYAYRPAAGQQFMNTGAIDSEQVLHTESGILSSDDLHRSVIREIGLARLYPKLLEPPTTWDRWMGEAKTWVYHAAGVTEPGGAAADDPMSKAIVKFDANLSVDTDRKSSVITLAFTNPDRAIARQVLQELEKQYLILRQKLYGDVQAPIVKRQQDVVAQQLADADAALAAFKKQHDISSYNDRRTILLRQQGELELALNRTQATISEQQARLDQLNNQLVAMTGTKKGSPNAAAALQGMVQAFRKREDSAQYTYRGSPAVDEARRQALERQTDIARMQSGQAFAVEADRNKTQADLQASTAGLSKIKAELADLNQQIAAMDADETQLHKLELNRGVLEDNYKAVTKILDEREVVETVNAHRESSIRVIQPPTVPPIPQPLRRLILIAGIAVSLLLAAAITLMTHFFKATYLRPEALEFDTGLIVLASVPETRAIGRSVLLLGPG